MFVFLAALKIPGLIMTFKNWGRLKG